MFRRPCFPAGITGMITVRICEIQVTNKKKQQPLWKCQFLPKAKCAHALFIDIRRNQFSGSPRIKLNAKEVNNLIYSGPCTVKYGLSLQRIGFNSNPIYRLTEQKGQCGLSMS